MIFYDLVSILIVLQGLCFLFVDFPSILIRPRTESPRRTASSQRIDDRPRRESRNEILRVKRVDNDRGRTLRFLLKACIIIFVCRHAQPSIDATAHEFKFLSRIACKRNKRVDNDRVAPFVFLLFLNFHITYSRTKQLFDRSCHCLEWHINKQILALPLGRQ